jgi:C4-type Zn-finger protein
MPIEMSVEPTALSGEVTEVEGFLEYSLDFYQTAVCHMPEVSNFGRHLH